MQTVAARVCHSDGPIGHVPRRVTLRIVAQHEPERIERVGDERAANTLTSSVRASASRTS